MQSITTAILAFMAATVIAQPHGSSHRLQHRYNNEKRDVPWGPGGNLAPTPWASSVESSIAPTTTAPTVYSTATSTISSGSTFGSANAYFTYYNHQSAPSDMTSCGKEVATNEIYLSNYFVALSNALLNGASGDACDKAIELTYNGNTIKAFVWDTCSTCDPTGIDLSQGAFMKLVGDTAAGNVTGSWKWA